MPISHNRIQFSEFELSLDDDQLFRLGELIPLDDKPFQILRLLVENSGQIVLKDEIFDKVWPNTFVGDNNLTVAISQVRDALEDDSKSPTFIQTVRRKGYRFIAPVTVQSSNPETALNPDSEQIDRADEKERHTRRPFFWITAAVLTVFTILFLMVVWPGYRQDNQKEVERVVKESQLYESLVVYKDPSSFDEADLDKFWTTELAVNSNYDRSKIRQAAAKLAGEGNRYGDETKCEQFDFESVEVNANGDMAVVKTLEKWFIAIYGGDGKLIRNRTVGPYFVSYILRKIDGRWLIEKSNTGRTTSSPPKLAKAEATTEAAGGKQFFVRLTGEDFLSEIVHVKITGEGCPENNPCVIPNSALLKHAKLSDTVIENVPLTHSPGDFQIFLHNGESQASNPRTLTVK